MIRQNQSYQVAPGAIAATGNGAAFNLPVTDYDDFVVGLSISGTAGTNPTLDIYLQTLGPDGNWYDVYHWAQQTGDTTAAHQIFAQIGVAGNSRLIGDVGAKTVAANTLGVSPLSNTYRFAYTIGGTAGPTFTPVFNFYLNNENHGGL